MARKQSGSNDDSLRLDLQELVNQVGLVCGELELVIHEGSIPSIKVRPEYRVEFSDTGNGTTEPKDEIIRLHTAQEFVRSRLEHPIIEETGPFGRAEVNVIASRVSDWRFTKRYRYTR